MLTIRLLDGRLADGVITSRGNGLKPALVNRFTAAHAQSITSFFQTHQCLVDVRHHLRFPFAKSQSKFFNHISQGQVSALFCAVVGGVNSSRLIVADQTRVATQLSQQNSSKVFSLDLVHFFDRGLVEV